MLKTNNNNFIYITLIVIIGFLTEIPGVLSKQDQDDNLSKYSEAEKEAHKFYREKKYPQAISKFKEAWTYAIKCDRADTKLALDAGNCNKDAGNCNKAIFYYEKAYEFNPVNSSTYQPLITCLLETGQVSKAIKYGDIYVNKTAKDVKKGSNEDKYDEQIANGVAWQFKNYKYYDGAIHFFKRSLFLTDKSLDTCRIQAYICELESLKNNYEKAILCYKKMIQNKESCIQVKEGLRDIKKKLDN